jgi:ABC-type transport system involved in cytochrome c biogenesis permease subunit
MNSSITLSVTTFIYGFAAFAFLYIIAWVFKKPGPGVLATWVAIVGLVGNTGGIVLRWVESYNLEVGLDAGHVPLSNLYESLVFFAWSIVLIYIIIERKVGNRIIGAFTTPIAFLVLAYASLSDSNSAPVAGTKKQLADCACYYLFYRLCRLCHCLRPQRYVPDTARGCDPTERFV